MKSIIAFVIGSFFIGSMYRGGQGYIVGGIVGYLLMQLFDLKSRIFNLEKQLKNKSESLQDSSLDQFNQAGDTESMLADEAMSEDSELSEPEVPEFYKRDDSLADKVEEFSQVEKNDSAAVSIDQEMIFDEDDSWRLSNESKQEKIALDDGQIIEYPKEEIPEPIDTGPTPFEIAFSKAKSLALGYFTGGNSLVRTGMLVLFIGVAFLLKYVAERTVVPVEYRYISISIGCLVLLVLGWKLRLKRPGFALSLQGGAIALLYLTLFAALRLHGLISPHTILFLLIAIVLLSAALAILQDSMALAVIGMIGGFAAPILTSTGSGSHVQLFSYYLLLNSGVFAISWFKSWRILNVIGFIATFGIGSLWGYKYYKPEFLMSVEPFLIANFLLYTVIAVFFAIKQPPKLKGINDGTIIFGTPLVGFALQGALMKDSEYGLAYSALALGVFYIVFAYFINRMKKPYMKDLIESFVALGIGFATLAIPLGFDGRVTSAMWTAEGSALLWVGIRQGRMFPRFSGYALSLLGMGAFFLEPKLVTGLTPWLNADYIGVLIIVLSTAFIGLYTRKHSDKVLSIEGELVPPSMLIISVCWWVFGGKLEISTHYLTNQFMFLEAFLAVTSIALLYLSGKVKYDLVKILSIPVALFMLSFIEQNIALLNQGFSMILNENFISFFIIAITHLFLSWYWSTEKRHNLSQLFTSVSYVFLATGLSVFVFLGHSEIFTYLSVDNHTNLSMLFMSVTFVLGVVLAHKLNWKSLHVLSYGFLPYLAIVTLYIVGRAGTFHENLGLLVWCIALLVNYWVLRVYDNDKMQFKKWYHLGSLLLFLFIAVFEYREFVTLVFGELTIWYNASLPFALLIISIGLFMLRNSSIWPLNNYRTTYIKYGLSIVLSLLWLTIIAVNILPPGKATIISYLPVLNAIDITGIMFLVFIWKVLSTQVLPLSKEVNKLVMIGLPITAFIILNASMLRTFHYWYGIDYEFSAMVSSFLVQSAFSILWSLTAVVVMVLASKKQWRIVWLAGLGLMVAVVIKLFLVDMSASGTIARIVAFVSVGLLLSLVGYFSPLPPDINKDKLQDNVFEDQFKQEEE